MNPRTSASLCSILALGLLAACSASPGGEPEESSLTAKTTAPLTRLTSPLPSDPNWAAGFSPDAVRIGTDTDGAALYPCRGMVASTVQPGKTKAGWNYCDISYGGGEQLITPFQTLVPAWTAATNGTVPPNASPFGYENGNPLYVCRAVNPSGSLQVGKVGNNILGCDYAYGGAEITAPAYQVLTGTNTFAAFPLSTSAGQEPVYNAIKMGTDLNGAAIFACAVPYGGGLQIGKSELAWGGCDISYGGSEILVTNVDYQVLMPGLVPLPLNAATVPFPAGTDANGTTLGICEASYAGGFQIGKYLSSGLCNFGYGGQEIALPTGQFSVFANSVDPTPITINIPSITWDSDLDAIGGSASLTLNPDGSYEFSGHLHDAGAVSYSENTLLAVHSGNGTVFTFSRSGNSTGTCCLLAGGSRDDNWDIKGTNPAIAAGWADLKKSTAYGWGWKETSSVTLDVADMWTSLKSEIGAVAQVVSVVGSVF